MSLAEMLPEIRSFSAADELRVIGLLAEQLDEEGDIAPVEHGGTYKVSTPAIEPGASAVLRQELM
jgi:hypothetical protein